MEGDDLMNWMASGYYTPNPTDLEIDWDAINNLLGNDATDATGAAETDGEGEGSS